MVRIEWSWSDTGVKLRDFIRELIALRADYPVLCRKNFLTGASTRKAAGL